MLPVKYRINKEFLPLILKQNRVFSSTFFNLRVHNRLSGELYYNQPARLAVIVPNKLIPLSVDRHLIKRRIHAVLEKIWVSLPNNLDIIVQLKKNTTELDFSSLKQELFSLLKTANLLK